MKTKLRNGYIKDGIILPSPHAAALLRNMNLLIDSFISSPPQAPQATVS
jgi:hypothetical protein